MKRIALFVGHPFCSIQGCNAIIESLDSKYRFKLFTKHLVEQQFFDDVDAVMFGGGVGDADAYENLLKNNGNLIKQYVSSGGKYVGICMGGYWAGSNYLNILRGCDTVQYIKRDNSDTKRPHAKNLSILWQNQPHNMFFYDGFAVTEGRYEKIASYVNGDAMAVIQDNVGIIGCHPEASEDWYDIYSWMKHKYVSKKHLLLEFVDSFV